MPIRRNPLSRAALIVGLTLLAAIIPGIDAIGPRSALAQSPTGGVTAPGGTEVEQPILPKNEVFTPSAAAPAPPRCRTAAEETEIEQLNKQLAVLDQRKQTLDSAYESDRKKFEPLEAKYIAGQVNDTNVQAVHILNNDRININRIKLDRLDIGDKLKKLNALRPCPPPAAATAGANAVTPATVKPSPAAAQCRNPELEARLKRDIAALDEKVTRYSTAIATDAALLERKQAQLGIAKEMKTLKGEELAKIEKLALKDPGCRALEDQAVKDGKLYNDAYDQRQKLKEQLEALEQLPPCPEPPAATPVSPTTPNPTLKPIPGEVAPEHTSVPAPSNVIPVAVTAPVAIAPAPMVTPTRTYYNTPFYNTPFYNTPYYNSPLEALFYNTPFYNSPFDYYDTNGWYFGPKAGWTTVPKQSLITHFSDGSATDFWQYSSGYDVGFRAGQKIGPWRFEGEFNYRDNSIDVPSAGLFDITGGTKAYTVLGNAIYDFHVPLLGPVTPHIGAGIGIAHVQSREKSGGFTVLDSGDTQFAYQGIAGLRVPLSPNWSFDLDYRYLATTDLSLTDPAGNRVTQTYNTHTMLFSLTYLFGVTPPSLPPAPAPRPGAALPQAYQVAALAPVTPTTVVPARSARSTTARAAQQTETKATMRFAVRFDDQLAALSPSGIRNLDAAIDAIHAGQDVRIAIEGCEAGTGVADGSPCARREQSLRQLLGQRGVRNPGRLFIGA